MTIDRFKIPRISDNSLYQAIQELAKEFEIAGASFTSATGVVSKINFAAEEKNELLDQIVNLDSFLINTLHLQHHALTIVYTRGGAVAEELKSPVYDEITLNFRDNEPQPSVSERLSIVAFLNKKLKRVELGQISAADVSPDIQHIIAIHQSNLGRLESLNEDLIKRTADFRDDLVRQFEKKISTHEAELVERKTEADKLIQDKDDALKLRENEIAERLKTIDHSDNTHARRKIRDRMLDDVKERIQTFGVSDSTATKRMPVLAGMMFLVLILLALIGWTTVEIQRVEQGNLQPYMSAASSSGTPPTSAQKLDGMQVLVSTPDGRNSSMLPWLWARLAVLSLSLAGTILYYIKWQNKWADQHANAEFQLQQFYIDVNRANWVVESCLEWRKVNATDIPADLLKSITNGLFMNPNSDSERVIHPADELASALMGSASKVKLKLGENELDIDKPRKNVAKPFVSASA